MLSRVTVWKVSKSLLCVPEALATGVSEASENWAAHPKWAVLAFNSICYREAMRWRNRHQGFRNCGGCCAMFRLNQLINIKAIFQSTEYLIDGFSLTRCTFLSGSTAPLEALCLKQHVRLILREVQAQCLAVSPLRSHISVWRDAFQPHGSWSIAQPPPQPPWLNEHTRYPGGASVRAGREQKRLLLRLAFWNPFKTVNELCYYLKILCTPHRGG